MRYCVITCDMGEWFKGLAGCKHQPDQVQSLEQIFILKAHLRHAAHR